MSVSPFTVGLGTLRFSHQLHQMPYVRKVTFKGIKHLILILDGLQIHLCPQRPYHSDLLVIHSFSYFVKKIIIEPYLIWLSG